MNTKPLGRLEKVDLRSYWERVQGLDYSSWEPDE